MSRKKTEAVATTESGPEKKLYTRQEDLGGLYEPTGVEANTYASTEHGVFEGRIYFRDGDPGPEARAYLKNNGFEWDRDGQCEPSYHFKVTQPWTIPIPYNGADARDTLVRVAAGVNRILRRDKKLDNEPAMGR